MHLRTAAVLTGLTLALAGCSGSVSVGGDPVVEEAELESEISTQLEETVGQAPDRIDCPEDLAGEQGTELRCVLYAGKDELGVTVTVTGVEGEQVDFDIEVDEEMMEQ